EAHEQGLVVPNKKHQEGSTKAAGAYVAHPKKGLHDWIGAVDLKSLYPSVIRACNMGPETIVGQLRPLATDAYIHEQITTHKKSFAGAWEGQFGSLEYKAVMEKDIGTEVIIDWESGHSDVVSAKDAYTIVFDSNKPWIMTANGTIFTYERRGVIPGLLARWYAERKELQAKAGLAQAIMSAGITIPNDISELLDDNLKD
ncbi:MAG: hypothetical protein H8D23_05050, partial [Candidatus Brocadiales bacterium]|nr:hypothetical protein [Candidatus Brocadiales bacterium]